MYKNDFERINEMMHQKGVFIPQLFKHFLYQFDLTEGAEVAGVNGVEGKPFLFPMLGNGGDLIGEIVEGEAGKLSVGGQNGGGHHGAFHTACGNNGQGNGQRTLAHCRNILYGNNSFHKILLILFLVLFYTRFFKKSKTRFDFFLGARRFL